MSHEAHLWAVGYENTTRADQVRAEITRLRGPEHYLILLDTAVVVRCADGSFTLDGEAFPLIVQSAGRGMSGFLAGLALAVPPFTGAAVRAVADWIGTTAAHDAVIDSEFMRTVCSLMKPGTSMLFVLDDGGNMDVILRAIRGLGGVVVRTNVDLARAKLIQSTLSAGLVDPIKPTERTEAC